MPCTAIGMPMGSSITDENPEKKKESFDSCPVQLEDREKLLCSERSDFSAQLHVELSHLSYSVRGCKGEEKSILEDVCGRFGAGKLTGILGPSGAGKTSLLSIVAGLKSSSIKGSILINGQPRKIEGFRRSVSYIPQEFALLPRLTTRESLCIAARIKLGRPHNASTRLLVVEEVAKKLSLLKCMDTMTCDLSGGEKKRLSIGLEILTNPPLLLLDEPTSGLDSAASNQMVSLMKNIARTGCAVVCAIHQPTSKMIEQFDDILVLSEGKSLYCGPTDDILATFQTAGYTCPAFYNIAEFVIEVVRKERSGDLEHLREIGNSKYQESKICENGTRYIDCTDSTDNSTTFPSGTPSTRKKEEIGQTRSVSTWEKQKVLFSRAIICNKRDNTMTKLRLAAHAIVALLLGLVFYDFGNDLAKIQSNVACLFFFLLFLFFANSMPAVQMFPIEAAVFLREHHNHWYKLSTYYIAKVLTDIPLQIICPSCFLLVAYCMTGQPLELICFAKIWLICILLTIVAQSLGIVTGAAFDTHAGCFLVPALNIPMFLFAGFFLKLNEVPNYLQFFCSISYFRYAFEGIVEAVYAKNRDGMRCSTDFCLFQNTKKILKELDMQSASFCTTITALLLWILCLHIAIYSVLRWKLHRMTK